MSRQLKRVLLVGALAVPFAELGHLVAYGARVPSAGSHIYFPTVLQLADEYLVDSSQIRESCIEGLNGGLRTLRMLVATQP